jgi:methylase of polypeptide subunit release factors
LIPLTIGTPEEFRALRAALVELNYTEAAICARTGAKAIYDFKSTFEKRRQGTEINDGLDVLIRLLMDGEILERAQIDALLAPQVLRALEKLGLVAPGPGDPERRHATAFLYPVEGLYVASDRTSPADPDHPGSLPTDVVYAAVTRNTRRFLATLPPLPCETLLDLCAGTGIAALVAARGYAGRAWACDITERSVRFSKFNALLNGLDNVVAAQGDLYEAVGDLTFDRIVGHPPYVPAPAQKMVFRDGGEDGEQILRRIIEGLPRHLAPGGRCYCVAVGTDREGETFEQRIRCWLGESEAEFDVLLIATEVERRVEEILRAFRRSKLPEDQADPSLQLLERLKVTATFYGAIVILRKTEDRPAATARVLKAANAWSEAIEWFVNWETTAARPGFLGRLLDARPFPSPRFRLVVTHAPANGALVPSIFELKTDYPFISDASCQGWMAVVIGACDGKRTGREIYAEMKRLEVIQPSTPEEEFAGILKLLISNGFLEIEGFKLPVSV